MTTVGLLRDEHVERCVTLAYLYVLRICGGALLSTGESIIILIGSFVSIRLEVTVVVDALHYTGHHAGRGTRWPLFRRGGCGSDLDQVRSLLGFALAQLRQCRSLVRIAFWGGPLLALRPKVHGNDILNRGCICCRIDLRQAEFGLFRHVLLLIDDIWLN